MDTRQIDGRNLLALLPHVDQADLSEVRRAFASSYQARVGGYTTWQEAWNAWTRASPGRPGEISYTPILCPECRGRHIDRRTWQPCAACFGTGKARRPVRQVALYAAPSETPRRA